MSNEEWSASRVAAALAKLGDAGYLQPKLAEMARTTQSTVSRWSRGRVRPGPDAVRRLAVAVWRDHPALARELVEASGYMWADPAAAELPPPELDDDPETLEALRRAYRNDPAKVREAIEALKWAESLPRERAGGEESGSERHAG